MKRHKKSLIIKGLISLILWIGFLYVVSSFPPEGPFLPLFFILLFFTLFFFLRIFSRLALTLSIGIIGYLLLRFLQMDNHLNLVLLLALMVTIGIYQNKG